MNTNYDVSIIIVNYNGKRYIDTLMDSLKVLEHNGFIFEIVFVDNASDDDSLAYLRENYGLYMDNLRIVESKINRGFAGGNNLGVQNASGEFVVLLNNDTKPDAHWLENLYIYIKSRDDVVMANSKLVFFYDFVKVTFSTKDKIFLGKEIQLNGKPYTIENKFCKNLLYEEDRLVCFGHTEIAVPLVDDASDYSFLFHAMESGDGDTIKIDSCVKSLGCGNDVRLELNADQIQKLRFSLIQNAGSGINENYDGFDLGFCQRDGEEFSQEYEISNACGAAVIFRKVDFEKCGMFDENFFMYYEDTDLSFRMKKDGRKIMYCPTAIVRHIHAGSSGEWSPFFVYHVYKNKLLFIYKNLGRKIYCKYFFQQLREGIREHSKSKVQGTVDSLKLVLFAKSARPAGDETGA